jgi:hypothetical protein
MKRRDFLKAILATGMAPAIVKAENIMRIYVPPEKKIIMPSALLTPEEITKEASMILQGSIGISPLWVRDAKGGFII